jgi:ribosomal protein S20
MTRTSSALKANRSAIRKTAQNKRRLTAIDKLIRQAKNQGLAEVTQSLQKAIDKAAARGVIHQNRASRLKSRLLATRTATAAATTSTKKKVTKRTKKPTQK